MVVVFITGCSDGGIGAAFCEEFLSRGCVVYASARSLSSMTGLDHQNLRKLEVDVTVTASVERAAELIHTEVDAIDILVSNAGVTFIGPALDISVEKTEQIMDVNFMGTVRVVHAFVPKMAERRRGQVVVVGSMSGEIGLPFSSVYNASKAALHEYTETLGLECRPLGVDVTLISAGTVTSNIIKNHLAVQKSPETSLYKEFVAILDRRVRMSQTASAMPASTFAHKVVGEVMKAKPPSYLCIGGQTGIYYILKWLPRSLALSLLWRHFTS